MLLLPIPEYLLVDKKSGYGSELSMYGMLEFVNIKSVRFYEQLIHTHHVE
jgi:succinate-semialdehyde dehydrogenase/glutarate-semialdehyde dehydrogenase/succinyl-CoA reductase